MATVTTMDDVQIVPMTLGSAEVRLRATGAPVSIGKVGTANGRWYWQHRDGEKSSPVAESRSEAATLLANYHRAFKPAPAPAIPLPGPDRVHRCS